MATNTAAANANLEARERASKLRSYDNAVIRLPPLHYVHILDINTNVTRLEVGPKNITCRDNERVVWGPEPMIRIPPRQYLVIENPVVLQPDNTGSLVVVFDKFGQAKLRHGDQEVRLEQDPFPLYPGERVVGNMQPLQVVPENSALRLRALRDLAFETTTPDGKTHLTKRIAGDEWLFYGPATYIPRVDVQIVETVQSVIVKPDQALRLKARTDFAGSATQPSRKAGEEWLLKTEGAFLPDVHETIVGTVKPYILTEKQALHLRATRNFVDDLGKPRKAGDEWLVTKADHELHLPHIYETVVSEIPLQVLKPGQYCYVTNPHKEGKPLYGTTEVRKGPAQFFLLPDEQITGGIRNVYILGAEQALRVRAKQAHNEGNKKRVPGERWYIYGPCEYVPPAEVDVLNEVRAIFQMESQNIYIFSPAIIIAAFVLFLAVLLGLLKAAFF